jgi:Putative Ig domain
MIRPVRSVPSSLAVGLFLTCVGPAARSEAAQAPTVDPIPVQFGTEGVGVRVQVTGHDNDGDQLAYSAEGLPFGLTIDRVTGLIGGQPATAGDSTIVVIVSDGLLTASTSFALHVASAPSIVDALVTIDPQHNVEGDRVDLDVELLLNVSYADNPGRDDRPPVGVFGMENLPPGLRFSRRLGRIHGHIEPGAAQGGPYLVVVTMTEGNHLFTVAFEWTVDSLR